MNVVGITLQERGVVHVLNVELDDIQFRVRLAVLRTELHKFAVLALGPDSGTILTSAVDCVCAATINHAMQTVFPNECAWDINFGETLWLSKRQDIGWRAIRRIEIAENGAIRKKGWFPPNIAEPLLRLLESSVPVTNPHLRDVEHL